MNSHSLAVGRGTEILFFDLAEMESLDRLVLAVCPAHKCPLNPVMTPGDLNQWDSAQCSPWPVRTVLYDQQENLFKAWYGGCNPVTGKQQNAWRMGYAISPDGIHWEKPNLGLYEYNSNKNNNIIHPVPYGAVIKDLKESDPRRRYKCHMRDFVRYSADGIHWPNDPPYENHVINWDAASLDRGNLGRVNLRWSGPQAWDVVAFVRDEQDPDPQRRFKFVFQYYNTPNKSGPAQVRFKGLACGPDELHMDADTFSPVLCPNDGFEQENHFLMYLAYKGHWLMLYECGWYTPDGTGKFGRYTADIRLAHSRDGVHFNRLNSHEPVIARGPAGAWDEQFIVISDKAIIKDDSIYLYYCGQASDWPSWPPQNASPNLLANPGSSSISQMGLATLRMDGFTCLRTVDGVSFGSGLTRVFTTNGQGSELALNLSQTRPGRDWVQVEVLNPDGTAIEGWSRSDCAPLAGDGLAQLVRWGGRPLSALGRREFRLRLHLFGQAQVHALKFL